MVRTVKLVSKLPSSWRSRLRDSVYPLSPLPSARIVIEPPARPSWLLTVHSVGM